MARLVMKFGGTSVADIDRIRNVAQHVKREVDAGHEVAVVVSAMAGATNQLVAWTRAAGERSALLRPESWSGELHPFLRLDATRADSLRDAGLDPAGSATLSVAGKLRVACFSLSNPKTHVERAAVLEDGAAVEGIGAEDRTHDLGPARTNQPGNAENLAGAQ